MYLSVSLIDARQVYLRSEGNLGRNIGIVWTAVDLDAVDAVLVNALRRVSRARQLGIHGRSKLLTILGYCTIGFMQQGMSTVWSMWYSKNVRGEGRGWYRSSPT